MSTVTIPGLGASQLSSTGGETGTYLAQVVAAYQAALGNNDVNVVTLPSGTNGPSIPAPTSGDFNVLVIPDSDGGIISVPSGYQYIVYSGSGSIEGGAGAIVIGDLNYDGAAPTVIATSGSGWVRDTADNAVLSFFSGDYFVDSSGNNQTVDFDSKTHFLATVGGSGSTVVVGTPPTLGGNVGQNNQLNYLDLYGNNDVVSVYGGYNYIWTAAGTAETIDIASGSLTGGQNGSATILDLNGAATINQTSGWVLATVETTDSFAYNGTGGTALIYDRAGGHDVTLGANTLFVQAAGDLGDTVTSSANGFDTVFALGTSMDYQAQASESLLFLGGAGAVTVAAGANATLFGGTGTGDYTVGTPGTGFANSFLFVGGGGQDTITETAGGATPTIWGNSNEALTVQGGAGTDSVKALIVAYGTNDSINAAHTQGGDTFLVYNSVPTVGSAGTFAGNTTLVGSDQGHESFVVVEDGSSPPAHSIEIDNWKATDTLFITDPATGIGPYGQGLNSADQAAVTSFLGGSSNQFTLSDGTTIVFNGGKPTSIAYHTTTT